MINRVKVLQVITGIAPGGAERALLNLVAGIDRSRFDVHIASLVNDLRGLDTFGHAGISVEVFDLTCHKLSRLKQLRDFVRDFRPDVIHAHMFHALVASAAATVFQPNCPALCFTSHRSVHAPLRSAVIRILKPFRSADITFTEGQHSELNADRTVVVPNGVQIDPLSPPRTPWRSDRPLRLVSVGRLAEVKDSVGLVRSFALADLPNAILEFVGAGPAAADIRRFAVELDISERVVLRGFRKNVRDFLRKGDIFVSHSKQEGMPMAIIEAGAEAMPVVATPVGAVPAMLGTNRGVLAEPSEFPMALRSLASAPDAALKRGRRLKAYVAEHYSIAANVRAHEYLYQELHDPKPKPTTQL